MSNKNSTVAVILYWVMTLLILGGGLRALLGGLDRHADLRDGGTAEAVAIEGFKAYRHVVIEVGGTRYGCDSAGIAQLGATVRYDLSDPARCRVAEEVGAIDWFRTLLGAAFTCLGLWMAKVGWQSLRRSGTQPASD